MIDNDDGEHGNAGNNKRKCEDDSMTQQLHGDME
jgi:hypothetical protein